MDLPRQERESGLSRSALIIGLYTALSLLGILISAGRGDADIYRIEGTSTTTWLLFSPILGVGVGLLVVVLSRVAVRRFVWARHLHRAFRHLLGVLTPREIAILAVASAVGEELLFRGALLPWLGLWPQAVIFALLHVGPGVRFVPWTITAFVIGVAFGYLYVWTGDLGAPIAAHFAINFLNLHFIARTELPEEPALSTSTGATPQA